MNNNNNVGRYELLIELAKKSGLKLNELVDLFVDIGMEVLYRTQEELKKELQAQYPELYNFILEVKKKKQLKLNPPKNDNSL